MPKMIFVNLPVADLAAATRFYEAIGCTKNSNFSDDNASSMMWSDEIVFMLLKHEFFSTFTSKPIADAHRTTAALFALSFESRDAVDTITEAAGKAGGKIDVREPQELDFMYSRAFEDLDGNIFEPAWMSPDAAMGQG